VGGFNIHFFKDYYFPINLDFCSYINLLESVSHDLPEKG